MVVDDEEDQLFTVKKTLEYADKEFNVITINNGANCLQYLKNNDLPNLILLDIMMPEMTGWELYDKIKENNEWREIPIVFLSARTDDTAENAGKYFYLPELMIQQRMLENFLGKIILKNHSILKIL